MKFWQSDGDNWLCSARFHGGAALQRDGRQWGGNMKRKCGITSFNGKKCSTKTGL